MDASAFVVGGARGVRKVQVGAAEARLCERQSGRAVFGGRLVSRVRASSGQVLSMAARGGGRDAKYGEMSVVVAGGTGFIGKQLVKQLLQDGNRVTLLTRSPAITKTLFPDAEAQIRYDASIARDSVPVEVQTAVSGADAVINLVGASIADGRWTPSRKQELVATRVNSTSMLRKAIEGAPATSCPKVFVCGSGIGYYGISDSAQAISEEAGPGDDFLAQLCTEWEKAATEGDIESKTRVVRIRTGVVFGKDGGALAKMLPIFAVGLGGPLGDGKQWVSWIHKDDEVGLIIEALKNDKLKGAVNAVAPNAVRFSDLSSSLGRVMSRPSFLPAPGFAVKLLLGELSTVVLDGQRVAPQRALDAGYQFKFGELDAALRDIVD